MYVYKNPRRLPLPDLPTFDISDEEFEEAVDRYAERFPATGREVIRSMILESGYYKHIKDKAAN